MKRTAYLGLSLLLMWALAIPTFAQTTTPDGLYTAWYGEKDPAKKTAFGEQFISNPDPAFKSSQYLTYMYQQVLADYIKAQAWPKVMETAEKLPTFVPNADNKVKVAVYTQAMAVANQNNNAAKTIEFGDKVLAIEPANLNALMFVPTAILTSLPTADAAKTAALTKAQDYAKKLLASPKPATVSDADWATIQGQAHFTIGYAYLAKNSYPEAITELEEAVKANKKDDQNHYNLGLAYNGLVVPAQKEVLAAFDAENAAKAARKDQFELDDLAARSTALTADFRAKRDMAIDAFARAVAIGGPSAAPARTQFERLYKGKNSEATADEMNQYIASKKAELGL